MIKNIFKFAWRNIWRNWRRTALTSSAIAFAVISILFAQSYMTGIFENFGINLIKTETGHVRIASREFLRMERILPKDQLVYDSQNVEESLSALPGIVSMTERIKFHLILSHGEKNEPCIGVGINPEQEINYLDLRQSLLQGNYLRSSSPEMIIGHKLAEKIGASVGDELLAVTTDINYSTYALTFTVAGIFRTGFSYLDKSFFYIPLAKAQELLDCQGSVHEILLLVKDPNQAPKTASEIQNLLKEKGLNTALAVVPWQDHFMIKIYMPFASNFFASILMVIMLISALVILNTMLMAVLERTHEIGVIKSMGMRNKEIVFLILAESLFIGLIGTGIGGIIGSALSIYTQSTGLDFSQALDAVDIPIPYMTSVLYPKFSLKILLTSASFALVTTIIATLYPARKAAKIEPAEALRSSLK